MSIETTYIVVLIEFKLLDFDFFLNLNYLFFQHLFNLLYYNILLYTAGLCEDILKLPRGVLTPCNHCFE